ncbi:hypothetical protein [Hydrogenophaga sp.]|uniref:hypothetical protein n=1 Tax=Hydrogenophaga sp. TaxID=1904254 RepID=UPI003F72BC1E
MFEMQKNFNWAVHQNDPNNWVKIPEFDVIPSTVSFVGFAYPILGPKDKGFLWRVPVWETVRTVRLLAKRRFGTLLQLRVASRSLYEEDLLDPEREVFSDDQAFAFFYDAFFFNIERAVLQNGKTLVDEQARSVGLARAMEAAVQLMGGQRPNLVSVASARIALARSGADAKHRDGRQAREWIRAEWATHRGAYDGNRSAFARDYCARLWNERFVKVTEKQLREVWLRDAPPAGKPAGLQASR